MVEQSYGWDAAEYARHSGAQAAWAVQLLERFELRGDEAILDIGCGDGKITAVLAGRVPRGSVLGIDSSAAMIEQARRSFPSVRYPNLSFAPGNALELDYTERFEGVFSNAALHWVRDHPRVLRGVARALKREGRLLCQMGGRGNAAAILAVLEELEREPPWDAWLAGFGCPYSFYGPEEYSQWLPQAGLRAERVELLPKLMRQQGREGLAGWVRTTWLPYTERIPLQRREEFIAAVVDRYQVEHPADGKGEVIVPMVRLEVEAVRP
jgi:trans-aconitate methyltransferase